MKFRLPKTILAMLGVGLACSAHAAVITKATTGSVLSDGVSWVGSTAPTSSDVATWDSATSLGGALTMATAQSWSGIDIQNATADLSISGAGALTLGTSGITIADAAKNLTFTNSVIFSGATSNVNVGTGRTLYLNGVKTFNAGTTTTLNGAGTVEIGASQNSTGAGDVVLNSGTLFMNMQGGTHNRTGSTTINGGVVRSQTSLNFFGTGTVNLNGGTLAASGGRRTWNNSFVIGGDFGVGVTGSTSAVQLSGNVDFGGVSRQVNVTSIFELNGTGGNGTIVKQGAGNLVLGAVNLSTLNINLAAGPMVLGGNGISQIGSLSGVAGTTISTNYNLVSDGLRTLSVNQTVDGTYAGTIGQGTTARALSFIKNGSANLTLSGTNTYTGTTTVNAGTLTAGSAAAFGTAASCVVTVNGGTLNLNGQALGNKIVINGGSVIGASAYTGTLAGAGGSFDAGTSAIKTYTVDVAGLTLSSLSGQGTFSGGLVTVNGTLNPGNSPGIITSANGLTITAGSTTTFEIAGLGAAGAADGYDQIALTGGVLSLNGTLAIIRDVNTSFSFSSLQNGDSFQLVNLSNGATFDVNSSYTFDFSQAQLGSGLQWDTSNFSTTGTISVVNAIPEPSSLGLFGLGMAGMLLRRRRKQA